MAEINSLKGAQSAPPDLSTLEEIYSCTKSGRVYNLKGSRQIGCFKAPATFSSGDSFTVNGSPATAYMGSDILDELSKDRWYRFILDKDSNGRPVLNFKSGRIKVEYTVNHSKMNTDGSSYTLDATKKYIGIKGKPASAPLNSYNGFTTPQQESVKKLPRNWIVNYKYPRNKYTVTCIDMCGGRELGRSSWEQYYETTASGAHQGTNTSTSAYYTNYGYQSYTTATVGLSGATVYRYFEERWIVLRNQADGTVINNAWSDEGRHTNKDDHKGDIGNYSSTPGHRYFALGKVKAWAYSGKLGPTSFSAGPKLDGHFIAEIARSDGFATPHSQVVETGSIIIPASGYSMNGEPYYNFIYSTQGSLEISIEMVVDITELEQKLGHTFNADEFYRTYGYFSGSKTVVI